MAAESSGGSEAEGGKGTSSGSAKGGAVRAVKGMGGIMGACVQDFSCPGWSGWGSGIKLAVWRGEVLGETEKKKHKGGWGCRIL